MDLGRWSLKNLGQLLGNVLDTETSSEREPFILNDSFEDLDRALALVRVGSPAERVLQAFVPFFEGGMMLRDGAKLSSFFLFGDTFAPAEPVEVSFGLEKMPFEKVLRMDAAPLLSALNVGVTLEGASAFAFRPAKDVVIVLFDHRPHPWQVFALENAYLSAVDTFARIRR